jgi:hypothetical protein
MAPDDKSSLIKGSAAWGAVLLSNFVDGLHSIGITTWGEASQAAACILSVLLVADFIWRKLFRRFAARRFPKLFPTRRRRRADFVDSSDQLHTES